MMFRHLVKDLLILIPPVLVLVSGICVADEYRTFTDQQGREINAKIVDMDVRSRTMMVEREDGRRVRVPANIFSVEDQEYIKEWLVAEEFFMNAKFRISVDQDKNKKGDDSAEVTYTIKLDNRTNLSIPAVKAEYCMCVKISGFNGKNDKERVETGSLDFGGLEQGSTKDMATKPCVLKITEEAYQYEDSIDTPYSSTTFMRTGYRKATEDKIAGIMLRVYGPMVGGEQVVREYSYPSGLENEFSWPRAPKIVVENKQNRKKKSRK